MRIKKSCFFAFTVAMPLLMLVSCKKETQLVTQPTVDNYIYEVNNEVVYQSNVEKTRQKTPELYLSILYSNLFQTTISNDDLTQLANIRTATGDKQMADELFLNAFVNSGNAIIPSNSEMRQDIEQFIVDTYVRFFLRIPSPYEVFELKKEIEDDINLTPSLIYQAFALSNEYKFY